MCRFKLSNMTITARIPTNSTANGFKNKKNMVLNTLKRRKC